MKDSKISLNDIFTKYPLVMLAIQAACNSNIFQLKQEEIIAYIRSSYQVMRNEIKSNDILPNISKTEIDIIIIRDQRHQNDIGKMGDFGNWLKKFDYFGMEYNIGDIVLSAALIFAAHQQSKMKNTLPSNITAQNRLKPLYSKERVVELKQSNPTYIRGNATLGVGVAEDAAGNQYVLVGSSEGIYKRPGLDLNLKQSEIYVGGSKSLHAEINIINYCIKNNLTLIEIGASIRVCPECVDAISQTKAMITTSTRN